MGNFLFCTRTLETCVCASSDKAYNMILWLCILCLPLCVAQKIQQQQQQINTVYKTAAPASYLQKKTATAITTTTSATTLLPLTQSITEAVGKI